MKHNVASFKEPLMIGNTEKVSRNERLARDLEEIVEWGGIASYRGSLEAAASTIRHRNDARTRCGS